MGIKPTLLVAFLTLFILKARAQVVLEIKIINGGSHSHQIRRTIISEVMKNKEPFVLGEVTKGLENFIKVTVTGGETPKLHLVSRFNGEKTIQKKIDVKAIDLNTRTISELRRVLRSSNQKDMKNLDINKN